jgi:hypothetical protein
LVIWKQPAIDQVPLNDTLGIPGFFPLISKNSHEEDRLDVNTIKNGWKDPAEQNEYGSMKDKYIPTIASKKEGIKEHLKRLVYLQEAKKEIMV